jgi:hypothetical protein
MLAGLRFAAEKLEIRCSASASYVSPADASFPAYTSYLYTPDYATVSTGCSLGVELRRADALLIDQTNITFACGAISWTHTISGTSPCEVIAVINDFQIFELSGTWRVKWSSINMMVNGSGAATLGGGAVNGGMVSVPSSIPLFGIAPIVGVDPSVYGFTGTNTGGFRYLHRTAYRTFPVTLDTVGSLGLSCPASAPDVVPSGDNTWSMVAKGAFPAASWSWVGAWPDLSKVFVRFPGSYESPVLRFGFPKAERFAEESCVFPVPVGDPPGGTAVAQTDELYPRLTAPLQNVSNTPGFLEDPLTYPTFAPFYANATGRATVGSTTYTNKKIQMFPSLIDAMLDNITMCTGLLGHPEPLVRLWNSWANPHWSFALWFPPDTAASSSRWDLLGSDSDIDYWYAIRQQHATHPSLPSDENTRHRVNVTTEPLTQSRIQSLQETLLGLPSWWGITRFSVENETFPTSFTTDLTSAMRFVFKNGAGTGTGTVGSTITLTTGDAIEFDMTSFTVFPYMVTTLSDRIMITWTDTNIASIKLFVVGIDGSLQQVGPTAGIVSGVVYRIPFGISGEWATSAGADFGASYLTDDYTPDAGVSGSDVTAATLADAERISSFNLLPGFSPAKIRIEITRAGAYTGAVTIDHPTFYQAPFADAQVFHENGHFSTILFKDGPMMRYGALNYYDWLLDVPINVPTPTSSVFTKVTIGDLWCFENNFLRGKDALDGLATRMAAEFISGEEFPPGVTKHLWRYKDEDGNVFVDSISGVVRSSIGPRFWYLNSYRSLPPLAHMPEALRETGDGWLENGDYSQASFSDISNKHPHIVPGDLQPELIHGGVNHLLFDTAPHGWSVGTFSKAVDNNESQDWVLRWDNTDWFSMRPWRGQVGIFGLATPTDARGVWHLATSDGRFLQSYASATGAYVRWWEYGLPKGMNGVSLIDAGSDYYQCRVCEDSRNRIHAVIGKIAGGTSSCFRSFSDDGGKTWSALTSMGITNGRWPTTSSSRHGDMFEAAFVFDSGTSGPGTIKLRGKSPGTASYGSVLTAKNSAGTDLKFKDGSFHLSPTPDAANRIVLTAVIDGETEPSSWFSTDILSGGSTFTRF